MSRRILITGANGQVGWELARQAADHGFEALAFTRTELDITDRDAVTATCDANIPGIIINAAAYTAVDRAEDEPELARAVNADAVGHLADTARALDIPLLHVSTDYVFDGSGSRPWRETDPVAPLGAYGRSKAEGEQRLRERLERHVILRTSWVFGIHGNNFVKTMLRLAGERDELRVIDDQHGAPTFAGHIANGLLEIARDYFDGQPLPWGTYHFAGTPDTTWHGFTSTILDLAEQAGRLPNRPRLTPISSEEYPVKAVRPKNSRMDCSRLLSYLALERNWRVGLEKILEASGPRSDSAG